MAQFDIHRNLGARRADTPFVVIVQSRLFDDAARRVVVPLLNAAAAAPPRPTSLNPIFEVEGSKVVLHPLQIVSVPLGQLGPKVGSLAAEGDRIIAALDLVITRAWG
jgi:toxin CcdB